MSNPGLPAEQPDSKLPLRRRIRNYCGRLPGRRIMYYAQRYGVTGVLIVLVFVRLGSSHDSQSDEYGYAADGRVDDGGLRFRSNPPPLLHDHKDPAALPSRGVAPVVPYAPAAHVNHLAPVAPVAPVAPSVPVAPMAPGNSPKQFPKPLETQPAAPEPQHEAAGGGLRFVSSHPTKPAPPPEDNWQEDMDRPYFPKSQDRYFSFNVREEHIEGMATKLPPTMSNYKNPCWFEEVPHRFTYNSSFFYRYYKAGFGQLPHGDWVTTFKNMENRIQYRKRLSKDGKGWRLRCYPYYFVLGFTKAGTTDYCHQLHQFPTLFSGIKKEPQYWNKIRSVPTIFPTDQKATRPSLSDYLDLYDAAAEGLRHKTTMDHGRPFHTGIVGDCDPQTVWQLFGWEAMAGNDDHTQPTYKTPSHLYSLNPKTKFIILLRDPVERAFSHYRFFSGGNQDAHAMLREFHENVNRTIALLTDCTRSKTTKQCIHDRTLVPKAIHTSVTVGLYSTHIREWLNVFPREQFLFLKSEDYFASRSKAITDTIDFLGLDLEGRDLSSIEDTPVINTLTGATAKLEMRHETERLLKNFFRSYNQDLANLLQDETFRWDY